MEGVCPTVVEPLVRLWCALHANLDLAWSEEEDFEFRRTLAGLDDELVAGLLSAKLAMANPAGDDRRHHARARIGSEILYVRDGHEIRNRLVPGRAVAPGLLGIGSRFGAAIAGLRRGQSLLWPDERWQLVEVRAVDVRPPASGWWGNLKARFNGFAPVAPPGQG